MRQNKNPFQPKTSTRFYDRRRPSCPCCLERLGQCVTASLSTCQSPSVCVRDKPMGGLMGLTCPSPFSALSASCTRYNHRHNYHIQGHQIHNSPRSAPLRSAGLSPSKEKGRTGSGLSRNKQEQPETFPSTVTLGSFAVFSFFPP